jgi:hypothetical protein
LQRNHNGDNLVRDEHEREMDSGVSVNQVGLVDGASPIGCWATRPTAWALVGPRGKEKRGWSAGPSQSLEGFWPMAIKRREKAFQFFKHFHKELSNLNSNQIQLSHGPYSQKIKYKSTHQPKIKYAAA